MNILKEIIAEIDNCVSSPDIEEPEALYRLCCAYHFDCNKCILPCSDCDRYDNDSLLKTKAAIQSVINDTDLDGMEISQILKHYVRDSNSMDRFVAVVADMHYGCTEEINPKVKTFGTLKDFTAFIKNEHNPTENNYKDYLIFDLKERMLYVLTDEEIQKINNNKISFISRIVGVKE